MRRPLSPHLQIYRLPLTAWLSITHRVTGVVLACGLVVLVGLIVAIPDERAYVLIQDLLRGPVGRGALFLWLVALWVHFCHGVRHLLWDAVLGFDPVRLRRHSQWELMAALGLTLLTGWWL